MPASLSAVNEFLAQPALAIVGVSRSGSGFGALARRELVAKGYRVHVVHPDGGTVDGAPVARSLADLPEPVGGVLTVVPPAETERVVRDVHAAGIRRVWMQQGSASEAAVAYCREHGIDVVSGECVLMYADPRGVHKFHGWLWRVVGKAAS